LKPKTGWHFLKSPFFIAGFLNPIELEKKRTIFFRRAQFARTENQDFSSDGLNFKAYPVLQVSVYKNNNLIK
jgi:hypothetical protein